MIKLYRAWIFIAVLVLVSACIFWGLLFFGALPLYKAHLTVLLLLSLAAFCVCIAADIHFAVRIAAEPPLPDRYRLNQETYPDLSAAYSEKLLLDEYILAGEIPNALGCDMTLYLRRGFLGIDCFLFLRADEYSQEMEDSYGSLFWDYLCRCHPDAAGQEVSLLSLVCIQHLTPAFETRVHANIQQVQGRYHLPAGVCFSDKTAYIPPQKGGRYKSRYKAMREILLRYI